MKIQLTGHGLARQGDASCDDAWIVRERDETIVAALADGMGSCREGGVAARRAVEMLADYYLARPQAWSPRRALAEFTAQINRQFHTESLQCHGTAELACTLSAVVIEGSWLYGCNVGDSPVFHWHQGRLLRLSEAHAMTQPEFSHVLTRAVGIAPNVEPHFFETEIADGDIVVLCSDGLTAALSEQELAKLMVSRPAARSLVSTARAATVDCPELRDDTSAIVLDIIKRSQRSGVERQRLEVLPLLRGGDTCDDYRLVRSLQDNARVWLAESADGTRHVLKFPPPEAAGDQNLRDAFVREAWNATRLNSPDLVRAWMPATPTLRYYAMEYVEASTLRGILSTGPLRVEEACELAQFMLRVGQFLLGHDLAHGDLKPDNILVLRTPPAGTTFRLLDLGSAAELFHVTSRAGTPSYLAPERFRGGPLSERTEIFAIGVTIYEALTRTYPYGEVERFQTPSFGAPPRSLSKLNPSVPPWLESVVFHAIEPDPERRYQNFSEMAYELERPEKVTPYYRKGTSFRKRDPVLFYKLLCLGLLIINLWLINQLLRK